MNVLILTSQTKFFIEIFLYVLDQKYNVWRHDSRDAHHDAPSYPSKKDWMLSKPIKFNKAELGFS